MPTKSKQSNKSSVKIDTLSKPKKPLGASDMKKVKGGAKKSKWDPGNPK